MLLIVYFIKKREMRRKTDNMETAIIVFRQTVVMFIYMFAGYLLFRTGKMTVKGSRDIATLLVWLVIPAVILNSFCVERSAAKMLELLQSAAATAVSLFIATLIARFIFRSDPVANFGAAFSNAGFIGIPLVQAAFGNEGVFWIVSMVAMLNMLQWSYGVGLLTGERSATGIRHLVLNPILAGIAIGLLLFLTGAGGRLPEIAKTTLNGVSALNAPLAMIVLGSYLAQSDLKKLFTSGKLYILCAVRLILIPLVTLFILRFMPFRAEMLLTVFIGASTPTGANVAVYAQLYDKDYPYACQIVVITTLLSIITLPLMLMLASRVLV